MKKTSKKHIKCNPHKHFERKVFLTIAVTMILSTIVYFMGGVTSLYKASVVSVPEHAPFNGTTYPIKKIPNWVKLNGTQYKLSYDEMPYLIDTPEYNPDNLKTLVANLKWGDPVANDIRNQKITYAVAYMAAYDNNTEELSGSHPAVDIKVPKGTPVYAIANGTVVKASNQSDGFGHHIVIQHNNFPTLKNKNAKETIFSSYSHMDDIDVSVGDTVKKGEKIGTTGQTGTATTPHLHFQIDTEDAPYHPYWPFTWKESRDAGLDFFSAVNEGLGKEKALKVTINSMAYVEKYLNAKSNDNDKNEDKDDNKDKTTDNDKDENTNDNSSNNTDSYVENNSSNNNTADNTNDSDNVVANNDSNNTDNDNTNSNDEKTESDIVFDIDVQSKYYVGRDAPFTITIKDSSGKKWKDGFSGEAFLASNNTGKISVNSSILNVRSFDSNGLYKGHLKKLNEGTYKLKITYNDESFSSKSFKVETISSENGFFTDVPAGNPNYVAIQYLVDKKIINGYSDGTFKPNVKVNRAEALKIILEGIDENLSKGKMPFKDVKSDEWYSKYVYTAYKKNIIEGNPDKTFRPAKNVNKAEFYKILLNGMDVEVEESVTDHPFSDVNKNMWYAKYFAKAKELEIIDPGTTNVNPSADMTRGEVAEAIYRLLTVSDKKVAVN